MREISPAADPATRTFPARIALIDPPATVALGMTATVSFAAPIAQPVIAVPLQALLAESGGTHAWVDAPASHTVRRAPLQIANVAGKEIVVSEGLRSTVRQP